MRTAIRIADAEGLAALTMRRIATELDVATMSLNRHVRNKDELITLMADAAVAEEPLPELGED
ncbi:TetR family transcriptional regulator [Streptomyces sp. NPDC002896]|uniref:TetR family transcriptional regulator n=1 Tax=Streptomyces sp. NPDC002896 TaxID=3154438 RepID=UPI00332A7D34